VPIIHEVFASTPDEVAWAKRVLAAFEKSGGAATRTADGEFGDMPVAEWGASANPGLTRPFRTATPAANGDTRRHSAGISEFESLFLNGMQRSVNRKVQGSNPCSGAIFVCKFG
jgi:hypothetical protein